MELLLNTDENTIQDKLIDLIDTNNSIFILSPYVTKNKALDHIISKPYFKLKLVIDFDPESLLRGSSCIDINQVERLIDNGQEVFYNPQLHSKLFLTDESVILGSSNFTFNGLSKRKESALHFKREFNQKIHAECRDYFETVIESSTRITKELLIKTIKILDEKGNPRNIKLEKLTELLSKEYVRRSVIDDYDLEYEYPKSINELQKGLKFDYIDYEEIEKLYKDMFPDKQKGKATRIAFIKDNLYVKNKGYNTKARSEKVSAVWKFYRDNQGEFDRPLKSYKDFITDRSLELMELYRKDFNIQPATGFFARKFEYLKERGNIDESFFNIKLSDFEEQWHFNLLKERIKEIDEFFVENGKIPDSYARRNIYVLRKSGILSIEKERKLRYEGHLRDRLYQIKKKYINNSYSQESMRQIIEEYFKKWDYPLKS